MNIKLLGILIILMVLIVIIIKKRKGYSTRPYQVELSANPRYPD